MPKTKIKKIAPNFIKQLKSLGAKKRTIHSFALTAPKYSFKLPPATCRKLSGLLLTCQPLIDVCQKHQRGLVYGLMCVSLAIILSGFTSSRPTTFFAANRDFIQDYSTFIAQSYGGMFKDTWRTLGQAAEPLTNVDVALQDTVEAYSAMFQVAAKPMSEFFAGTGQVIAAVSFAAVHSDQVLAVAGP